MNFSSETCPKCGKRVTHNDIKNVDLVISPKVAESRLSTREEQVNDFQIV